MREAPERIEATGRVLQPLDLEKAWAQVATLMEEGIEGIAVCFLHAHRNPVHEKALGDLIRARAPNLSISLSHEVSPEFREYERTMTTPVNAFVGPVVSGYVGRLDVGLRAGGYSGVLHIMQSNGGAMPAESAGANAVRMLLSGPAARALDAVHAALDQIALERVPAQGSNTTTGFYLTRARKGGGISLHLDVLGGGWGAAKDYDGVHATDHILSSCRLTPVEAIEQISPI